MTIDPNYTPQDDAGCIFCGRREKHVFDDCGIPTRVLQEPTTLNEELAQKAWILGMLARSKQQEEVMQNSTRDNA